MKFFGSSFQVPWSSPRPNDPHGFAGAGGDLRPECLLRAYSEGVFPWYSEGDPILWWSPDPRAIFDVAQGMYISKRLARTIRSPKFQCTINQDFLGVMEGCSVREEGTWILPEMLIAYDRLHRLGYAHSVEVWQDGLLAGGVYGVAIGGFFAAESMFHYQTDASKVGLAFLINYLRQRGFTLLDIQFLTEHTTSLGGIPFSRIEYLQRLEEAIHLPIQFVDPNSIL